MPLMCMYARTYLCYAVLLCTLTIHLKLHVYIQRTSVVELVTECHLFNCKSTIEGSCSVELYVPQVYIRTSVCVSVSTPPVWSRAG